MSDEVKMKSIRLKINRDDLYDFYVNHRKTMLEIAKPLGVSIGTIKNWLDKYEIPRRSGRDAWRCLPIPKEELISLYSNQHLTLDEISRRFSTSSHSIRKILKVYEIPKRPFLSGRRYQIRVRHLENRETKICPICGSSFSRYKVHFVDGSCCSRKCSNIKKIKVIDVELARQMYEMGMSSIEIAKKFHVSSSIIIRKLHTRGVPTRPRGWQFFTEKNPTKGKGHTDETRAKLRVLTKKQFSNPVARENAAHKQVAYLARTKRCVSSWEKKVAAELDLLDINYEQSKPIRDPKTGRFGACLDFFIKGMALEVNGTYYHSDPRAYPNGPQTYTQRYNAERYESKKLLIASLGIPLFELWEMDLQQNLSIRVSEKMSEMGLLQQHSLVSTNYNKQPHQ